MTEEIKTFVCANCQCEKDIDELKQVDNKDYCRDCFDDLFFSCYNCGEINRNDDAYQCSFCENYFCKNCWDEEGGHYCNHCESSVCGHSDCCDNHDNGCNHTRNVVPSLEREPVNTAKCRSDAIGEIIKSSRTFGYEIECYYPDNETAKETANLFSDMGIAPDGSLSDKGIEFNTPILQGKEGEEYHKTFCQHLQDSEYKVNRTCGLHLHLGAKDFVMLNSSRSMSALKRLWGFAIAFDDVIRAMLPKERRENRYCLPLKNSYAIRDIFNCNNLEQIEKKWYKMENENSIESRKKDKQDSSRYLGFNLHSIFYRKTLEIRYHSATLNATKMLYWTDLWQTIMDRVMEGIENFDGYLCENYNTILLLTEKINKFFEVLRLASETEKYLRERIAKFNPELAKEMKKTKKADIAEVNEDKMVCVE